MQNTTCRCDGCGVEQGDANGWFAVRANLWFVVVPFEAAVEERAVQEHEHICGQECLHKRLSQWLETNSRSNPAT